MECGLEWMCALFSICFFVTYKNESATTLVWNRTRLCMALDFDTFLISFFTFFFVALNGLEMLELR